MFHRSVFTNRRFMRSAVLSVLLVIFTLTAGSWELSHDFGSNFAYYFDDNKGGLPGSSPSGFLAPDYSPVKPSDSSAWTSGPYGAFGENETRNLGNGWGALELEFYYRFRAARPLLQRESSLTQNNNIRFEVKPAFSPVSLHLETEVRFTPIAFLQFFAGFHLGSGWYVPQLGVHGLALNTADDITHTTVSGLYTQVNMGATFQFDLAALMPGEYNHVVLSLTGRALYLHYNQASAEQAWYWRGDAGQNFNAWKYSGTYAVGWKPPWKVDFIGFLAQHKFWLSPSVRNLAPKNASGENWGSDAHKWRFGPVVNIALNNSHSLTVLLQFKNGLYYTEESSFARYFRRWHYAGKDYTKLERIALAYTWNL